LFSHQRGKTKKLKNKNLKKIRSSNAIQFQLVLQHLLLLSHQRKRKKKRKGVWRQLCEHLSEAVAHLPPTVGHLLLQAFIYLEFSWMHVPFVFSNIQPYPTFAIAVFFFIYSLHGEVPLPPLVELSS
jgi:hypothetical protein